MGNKEEHLVTNSIRTPDGTVLTSYHRQDYVTHTDANGEEYMLDGGLDYIRRSLNEEKAENLSVYSTDAFLKIREGCYWGTYGKEGKDPLKWKALKALSTNHIKAILETQESIPIWRVELFEEELKYRKGLGNALATPKNTKDKKE